MRCEPCGGPEFGLSFPVIQMKLPVSQQRNVGLEIEDEARYKKSESILEHSLHNMARAGHIRQIDSKICCEITT